MQALRSNGFRSALTILGIVIGITTVVTVSSLLTGLRKGVVTFFEEFGPNNIFIARFTGDPSQPKQKELRRRPINPSYAPIIERLAPSVEQVGLQLFAPPVLGRTPVTARVPGFETDRVQVSGQSANMFEISPRNLKEGRVPPPKLSALNGFPREMGLPCMKGMKFWPSFRLGPGIRVSLAMRGMRSAKDCSLGNYDPTMSYSSDSRKRAAIGQCGMTLNCGGGLRSSS